MALDVAVARWLHVDVDDEAFLAAGETGPLAVVDQGRRQALRFCQFVVFAAQSMHLGLLDQLVQLSQIFIAPLPVEQLFFLRETFILKRLLLKLQFVRLNVLLDLINCG